MKSQPFKSNIEHPSAIFISNSAREPIIEVNFIIFFSFIIALLFFYKDSPGPTTYDVPRAYQALTSQHRQAPRTKNAYKRHFQFLSAAKRNYANEISLDTPGPAAYDGFITARPYGYAPVYEARFRNENSKIPGPADYEVRNEKN